jgi:hypothetical protein
MNKQVFVGGNMNNYSYTSCAANSVNHNNTLYAERYTTMDLCSQAQMSEDADNILSRMDKLRTYANEQQAKRSKTQRQQTSFVF